MHSDNHDDAHKNKYKSWNKWKEYPKDSYADKYNTENYFYPEWEGMYSFIPSHSFYVFEERVNSADDKFFWHGESIEKIHFKSRKRGH